MSVHVYRERIDLEGWLQESMARWRNLLGPGADLRRTGQPLEFSSPLELEKTEFDLGQYSSECPEVCQRPRQRWRSARLIKKAAGRSASATRAGDSTPKESKNIMKPFYRARAYAQNSIPGTGLGLYIAASASRALGMKIHGFSAGRGQGAIFLLEGKEVSG